jgi:hypothetical protein
MANKYGVGGKILKFGKDLTQKAKDALATKKAAPATKKAAPAFKSHWDRDIKSSFGYKECSFSFG